MAMWFNGCRKMNWPSVGLVAVGWVALLTSVERERLTESQRETEYEGERESLPASWCKAWPMAVLSGCDTMGKIKLGTTNEKRNFVRGEYREE